MRLILVGAVIFGFAALVRLVPTIAHKQDERVISVNRTLKPVLSIMMVGGLLIMTVGGITLLV